jgi:hypothetical protein
MLTFEEKQAVMNAFPELQRKSVSLGRVNYHYEESVLDKKIVVYHLHPNGNGYVYAGQLQGYETDEKGFVNIRDYGTEELQALLEKSIRSLSFEGSARTATSTESDGSFRTTASSTSDTSDGDAPNGVSQEERWLNAEEQMLVVTYEDDLWYVFADSMLETACETYEEVEAYMRDEGFVKQA